MSFVEGLDSNHITDILEDTLKEHLICESSSSEDQKEQIQENIKKFMKNFREWHHSTVVPAFKKETNDGTVSNVESVECSSGNTESEIDLEEEAELNYKATLLAITKKRKTYPSKLTRILGQTLRVEKNAIEVMKVELPLHAAPELILDNSYTTQDVSCDDEHEFMSDILRDVQVENSRMKNFSDALNIIKSNNDHLSENL